jgi:hypothetical protein
VLRRAFNIKYKVLDDMKLYISPEFLEQKFLDLIRPTLNMIYGKNFSEKNVLEPLQPHEINDRCLKSVATSKQKTKHRLKPNHFFVN